MAIQELKASTVQAAAGAGAGATPPKKAEPTPTPEPKDQVELSTQAQQETKKPYQLPSESEWHPPVDESERTPELVNRQNASVEEALRSNQPVSFTDASGKSSELQITRDGDNYRYTLNGKPVDVDFTQNYSEQDRTELLARLADYHSRSPEFAQDSFKSVTFADRPEGSNTDARFSSSGQNLTFFGKGTLDQTNFDHEVGHAVGYKESYALVPEGWSEAARRDGREISTYGKSSHDDKMDDWFVLPGNERADDFAESYAAYKEAKEAGPEALQQFREAYPERARLLSKYFPEQYDSPMPESPLSREPVYA